MSWQEAVEAEGEGCLLKVEVTPGAKHADFPSGFNEWRDRITMRVHGPPEGGRANREVVAAVAHFFGVPPGRVQIEHGHHDRQKTIAVAGVGRDAALARLAQRLGEDA